METLLDGQTDVNSAELAKIEVKAIAPLEAGFTKFDALTVERARLESEVKRAITEEAAILNYEDLNEKDAVRKLVQTRAVRDVQASRLSAAERRVNEQRLVLLESAAIVRRNLGNLLYYVRTARIKRATAIIQDLIEGPVRFGSVGLMDIVRRVKFVREIDQATNRVTTGQNIDADVELTTVKQLARQWFEEVKSLVLTEPGFSLQDVMPKQVPAEGESELAEVEQPGELVEA
jgi:hypothetical protein